MKKLFFIGKNAQRSSTPNVQKATFKNAAACQGWNLPPATLEPTSCNTAFMQCSRQQNLSRQQDRRDLLTGCRVLASSNGVSYVDVSRHSNLRHPCQLNSYLAIADGGTSFSPVLLTASMAITDPLCKQFKNKPCLVNSF